MAEQSATAIRPKRACALPSKEIKMKTRLLVTLALSCILALPALAQQASSNSSTQQAAPAASQSDNPREPLQPIKSRDFWDGDDPNVFNLILHPFASKTYVKRHVQPIHDRLNELDEITAADKVKIKDVDARAQQGIQLASEKTTLADQHATDAATRAQTAQMSATQASTRVSTEEQVVGNLDQFKGSAQTEIRFRPGQTVLSKQAKDALDQMADPLKDQHSYIIEIQGYSAGHGQAAIAASQKMADSVVRYLVTSHQIPVYRIYVLGLGNTPVAGDAGTIKHTSGGRVEVSLLKNDQVSSAQR
jgi:outer membrane protein OmpA-like peptidoglycan-associated protein